MHREVSLEEVLRAREERVRRQSELREKCGGTLISFTMNIAGAVKDSPLIRRGFLYGCRMLDAALSRAGMPVLARRTRFEATGCEALCAVEGEAGEVKRLCVAIEEAERVGRLFDLDVLGSDGVGLSREGLGFASRGCLVCGAAGRGCAARQRHGIDEVRTVTERILREHFAAEDRRRVASLVTKCLLDEVDTTPKPGLVDRRNCGSHRDMDVSTFRASAAALTWYWARCMEIGQQTQELPPERVFAALRQTGMEAERHMMTATGGVNTHKGAIFLLGAVCGAIGRLWRAEAPCRDTETILNECRALGAGAVRSDWAALAGQDGGALTAGQRAYLNHGQTGIRGELAQGMPGVAEVALPAFRRALEAGYDRSDAGAAALICLIARGTDTNMIARGGAEKAKAAAEKAAALVRDGRLPTMKEIEALDDEFIRDNLSPGGCADLLAATYFLYDWAQEGERENQLLKNCKP